MVLTFLDIDTIDTKEGMKFARFPVLENREDLELIYSFHPDLTMVLWF